MIEKAKKNNRSSICEEDVSIVLQRYSPTIVLALLQEVALVPEMKIDWNALVKTTVTGISNAREYQMLWRHIAYRHALYEKLEEGAEPLEDDSDLEYELDPLPVVSSESLTEAAACVKVLIASGSPRDSSVPNSSTVEGPLTINLRNGQSSRPRLENSEPGCSTHGTYITIPVPVQRQPAPALIFGEGLDANVTCNGTMPSRRKRKPWSEAEDLQLIAAVQKCGEGNWANILRGDFKGDRTASQLSQRWAIIRKRHSNLNVVGNSIGTQLSEDQVEAARRAMSLALDMPVNNVKAICMVHSESAVKATAVAAGARIASPSGAASILKVAQGKNAIHIMPTGSGSIKSSINGGGSVHSNTWPNVHYIPTLKSANSLATYPPIATHPLRTKSAKTLSSTVQHKLSTAAPSAIVSNHSKSVSSNIATEPSKKQEVKYPKSGEKLKQEIQENEACHGENTVSGKINAEKASSLGPEAESGSQATGIEKTYSSMLNVKMGDDDYKPVTSDAGGKKELTDDNKKLSSLVELRKENQFSSKKDERGISVICNDVERREHPDDGVVSDLSIDVVSENQSSAKKHEIQSSVEKCENSKLRTRKIMENNNYRGTNVSRIINIAE